MATRLLNAFALSFVSVRSNLSDSFFSFLSDGRTHSVIVTYFKQHIEFADLFLYLYLRNWTQKHFLGKWMKLCEQYGVVDFVLLSQFCLYFFLFRLEKLVFVNVSQSVCCFKGYMLKPPSSLFWYSHADKKRQKIIQKRRGVLLHNDICIFGSADVIISGDDDVWSVYCLNCR